jgi:exopolyphosphatase / guanosine-5'-triphosphate,3'-diphosphate pyrophosphatase
MAMRRVAVIDNGSNSIKCMVACRASDGDIESLLQVVEEVRISRGIGHQGQLQLDARALDEGPATVAKLVARCRQWDVADADFRIVATSAVRDASNGEEYRQRVLRLTGLPLTILSGDQESELIARGVAGDPAIRGRWPAFQSFDLGGGSLEISRFAAGRLEARCSLQLGAVRLTEQFVADPQAAIPAAALAALRHHVRTALETAPLVRGWPLVGCGGAVAVAQSMARAVAPVTSAHAPATGGDRQSLTAELMENWIGHLSALDIAARRAIPGLPASRADIMPAALIVCACLIEATGGHSMIHSTRNLRYGLADLLLSEPQHMI